MPASIFCATKSSGCSKGTNPSLATLSRKTREKSGRLPAYPPLASLVPESVKASPLSAVSEILASPTAAPASSLTVIWIGNLSFAASDRGARARRAKARARRRVRATGSSGGVGASIRRDGAERSPCEPPENETALTPGERRQGRTAAKQEGAL